MEGIRKVMYDKEEYRMTVYEECWICKSKIHGDLHIIKIPEGVEFCLKCSEKYPDDPQNEGVWGVYKIGEGFIDTDTLSSQY